MDCSLPGSSVYGISARTLEWVASPSPEDLPNPRTEPRSPALQADSLPPEPAGKPEESIVDNNKYVLNGLSIRVKFQGI